MKFLMGAQAPRGKRKSKNDLASIRWRSDKSVLVVEMPLIPDQVVRDQSKELGDNW
jgi:hypothetical protein